METYQQMVLNREVSSPGLGISPALALADVAHAVKMQESSSEVTLLYLLDAIPVGKHGIMRCLIDLWRDG